MAVTFTCPRCGQSARILSGGRVEAHEKLVGGPCDFTRTARSGQKPRPVQLTPGQAAELERKRAAFQVKAAAHARAKAREGDKRSRVQETPARVSDEPGAAIPERLAPKGKRKGKKKTKPKGSVWTVGGGLPGLGRRR